MNTLSELSKIEPVLTSDFPELAEVWEASVRATHHFLQEEDIVLFKDLLLKEFLFAVALVCVKDEQKRIVGFLGTSPEMIEMLFIHPLERGKGIGSLLLNYALETLKIQKVDVNEQNTQAVNFYLNKGFEVSERTELDGFGKPYPILKLTLKAETPSKN